jgi:phenylacetate-CoA ligase
LISPFQLNEEHFESIYKQILDFKPAFVHGLPSGVSILADYFLKSNKKVPNIKAILCGSENITDKQRKLIEKAFSARLFTWYGQTEKVVLGGECEHDSGYHIFPEYGYTELIDENNIAIDSPGVIGEIVGTSFVNMAQPLIRYRTGDMGIYKGSKCNLCKRNYLIIEKVVGRRNFDVLIDKACNIIPFIALDLQKKIFNKVYQWQFIQSTPGIVKVDILANEKITDADLLKLAHELDEQTDERIHFKLSVVNELRKTVSGKTKTIINELTEARQLSGIAN